MSHVKLPPKRCRATRGCSTYTCGCHATLCNSQITNHQRLFIARNSLNSRILEGHRRVPKSYGYQNQSFSRVLSGPFPPTLFPLQALFTLPPLLPSLTVQLRMPAADRSNAEQKFWTRSCRACLVSNHILSRFLFIQGVSILDGQMGSQHPSPNVKNLWTFETQIWLEMITSRDAKSACFEGSQTSEIKSCVFFAKIWPKKMTSRDGCVLLSKIANRQSLAFSERSQLSQAIPQFHVQRMLNERTPIARFEWRQSERKVCDD